MRNVDTKKSVIVPVHAIEDNGTVRIGFMSPSLAPVRSAPASSDDKGAVRVGFMSRAFRRSAARRRAATTRARSGSVS